MLSFKSPQVSRSSLVTDCSFSFQTRIKFQWIFILLLRHSIVLFRAPVNFVFVTFSLTRVLMYMFLFLSVKIHISSTNSNLNTLSTLRVIICQLSLFPSTSRTWQILTQTTCDVISGWLTFKLHRQMVVFIITVGHGDCHRPNEASRLTSCGIVPEVFTKS